MPRLRTPSLKVRQNADVQPSTSTSASRRGRGGRPRGAKNKVASTSRRGRGRTNPWEREDEDLDQLPDYDSHHSDDDSDSDEDIDDVSLKRSRTPGNDDFDEIDDEPIDDNTSIKLEPVDELDIALLCPWKELDPADIPPLELPDSSCDIPLERELLMDMIEIYEILRSFYRTLKLSPFGFEDFCAAMSSTDNSCLLSEIHISLLKLCLKSDDEEQIHYAVIDTNNSFNIMHHSIDSMTYAEVLRQYLESDPSRERVPEEIIEAISTPNYPFVNITIRARVIAFLCYRFLDSAEYKKVVANNGKIVNDDACRVCSKTGHGLANCTNCEAAFHVSCSGASDTSAESWMCDLCKTNQVRGVTESLPIDQVSNRQPLRMEPIGRDRHGRIYWFVVRRIIVQDEAEAELYYYSTAPQLYELVRLLDPHHLEYNLCKTLCEKLGDILEQMAVTLEMSAERREAVAIEANIRMRPVPSNVYLHLDNVLRMPLVLNDVQNRIKHESMMKKEEIDSDDVDTTYQPLSQRMEPLLGIQDGHLVNTFWSGQRDESYLTAGHTPALNIETAFRMGCCSDDDSYKKYQNNFTLSDYSDSPAIRKKSIDRKKYMSTRFSLMEEGDRAFQWSVAKGKTMYGSDRQQAKYIEWTLGKLAKRIPPEMMHRKWSEVEEEFRMQLLKADSHTLLAAALLRFEAAMRRTLFHSQFWNSLGHTRLVRSSLDDRELQSKEAARRKKEEREITTADPDDDTIVRVKYTRMPSGSCSQGLWRQKDEHYRIGGRYELGGWQWVSRTFERQFLPLAEHPAINIEEMSPEAVFQQSRDGTLATRKAIRLHGILNRLSAWRTQELIVVPTNVGCECYSPSCQLGIPSGSISADDPTSPRQSCYSQACQSKTVGAGSLDEAASGSEPLNDTRTVAKARDRTLVVNNKGVRGEDIPFPLSCPNPFTSRRTKRKSLLILPDCVLRKLAKSGGRSAVYIPHFSITAKSNFSLWNYPCPRPCLDLCWRWLTSNACSLHAVALQLKILWYSVKWSDFDPSEDDAEDGRVIVHHPDRDDLRRILKHKEFPPQGVYERYLVQIESVMLDDEKIEEDDSWNDRSDRRRSGRSSTRIKKSAPRTNQKTRKFREEWIDGVELKVSEIRAYWQERERAVKRCVNGETPVLWTPKAISSDRPTGSFTSTPSRGPSIQNTQTRSVVTNPASSNTRNSYHYIPEDTRKRIRMNVPTKRFDDYAYDDIEFDDVDSNTGGPVVKRHRLEPDYIALSNQQRTLSPNRRTSHGFEYDGGMIRGGGRINREPVGDGMRRVVSAIPAGSVPTVGPVEIVRTGQPVHGVRTARAPAGGSMLDEPPVISRYDSQGGSFGSQVAPRGIPSRQLGYAANTVRQQPGGASQKVLMIRRSDGTTQFLRPVNSKDGDGTANSGAANRPIHMQTVPTATDQTVVVAGPGQHMRRVVTAVRSARAAGPLPLVRADGSTKVLRIGPNGQQITSVMPTTSARLMQQRQGLMEGEDPFMKRMAAEKASSAAPIGSQAGPPIRRPMQHQLPQRLDNSQVTYSDAVPAEEYAHLAEQGIRPQGRPPARIAQTYGYGRPVQRIISRGGSTMHMGQRMMQADGFRPVGSAAPVGVRRVTTYKEFCMKRGLIDNMRLPSRPYRFEFESNEDEERAIAEAIAREEEIMRQEEESKREQRGEGNWHHPRIIDRFGQVGTNLFSQLSKQPLTYSSNLMPTKEDGADEKSIKQVLDTLITQVCRWDKQFGWYKSLAKRPRNRIELDKIRSRRMFSNQREVMLAEHVEKLRKEINKRRTLLENNAEFECGMLTPWRKARGRPNRAPKRIYSPEPDRRRKVVNPAEISLGGDSVDWTNQHDIKEEDDTSTVNIKMEITDESPVMKKREDMLLDSNSARHAASLPIRSRSSERLRKAEAASSGDEVASRNGISDMSRKRGRPPKKEIVEKDEEPSDDDMAEGVMGDGTRIEHPVPEGMDPNALHCLCQKPYNPYKFYIACDSCFGWYHGKCVDVSEDEARQLAGWSCPSCSTHQVYCICRTPYDESRFYVGCDGCEGWFHPACVNITQEAAESMERYLCPECSGDDDRDEDEDEMEDGQMEGDGYDSAESGGSVHAALSRADYPLVWRLLDVISEHRMAWPFKQPVAEEMQAQYLDIVNSPIDLSIIQKRLENLEYHTLQDFARDMILMFENARLFYSKENPEFLCMETLEKIFDQHLAEVKSQIEGRMGQDRRKASECRTIDSSLDIDTDQLMDVEVDPSMFQQLI